MGRVISLPQGLGYMARIEPEFDKRNVKIFGLSTDPVENHAKWATDIGVAPSYPVIGEGEDCKRRGHAAGRRFGARKGSTAGLCPLALMTLVTWTILVGRGPDFSDRSRAMEVYDGFTDWRYRSGFRSENY